MSRCLIISQVYKRPTGLPVSPVILIDSGQVGSTTMFVYTVCRQPTITTTGLKLLNFQSSGLTRICKWGQVAPRTNKNIFISNIQTFISALSVCILCLFRTNLVIPVSQFTSVLIHYSPFSVPWGSHKLDPIMRDCNDCLCIFSLDFQLYIADIIVLDAVCCGI